MTYFVDTTSHIAVCVEIFSECPHDTDFTANYGSIEPVDDVASRLESLRDWRYGRRAFKSDMVPRRMVFANGTDLTDAVDIDFLLDSAPSTEDPDFSLDTFPPSMVDMMYAEAPKSYTATEERRLLNGEWAFESDTVYTTNFDDASEPLDLDFVVRKSNQVLACTPGIYSKPFTARRIIVRDDSSSQIVWRSEIVDTPECASAPGSIADRLAEMKRRASELN